MHCDLRWGLVLAAALASLFLLWPALPAQPEATSESASASDFRRHIQPLLAEHCFKCRGPDKRRSGLLLNSREAALAPTDSGKRAIVPGNSGASELIRRVDSADDSERMPPTGDRISAEHVWLLRAWIDNGAAWPDGDGAGLKHWAYVKPVRPPLPAVQDSDWPRNAIDFFVLARLEKEGLAPAPSADRARLIRRVFLDLIGLPPTPVEIDAFLAADRPDAYERLVDRLLASPHYGERWARQWLDLARYADSNGYQRDGFRTAWPYRDWVIQAFNQDLPFDRFTVEQMAGDLLPGAGLEQKIATGFHRCNTVNVEGGVDREEVRVLGVLDRVNTTATVWLGTTLACAQCHNHKYDPFSQRDYYQLFAYFNNTPIETAENAGAAREFTGPKMELPQPPEREAHRQALARRRDQLDKEMKVLLDKKAPQQAEWERRQLADMEQLKKLSANLRKILAVAVEQRSKKQQQDLADHFASLQPDLQQMRQGLTEMDKQLDALRPSTTLVLVEMDRPRPTHVLKRGNFLDLGPSVRTGVPATLHSLPPGAPPNRLGLAQWLVAPDNPLLGRVTVNRWWAEFFGHGLVATLEDFGTQGKSPSHPELLDWLATEFVAPSSQSTHPSVEGDEIISSRPGRDGSARGWSMKAVHRLIVTSATYRQASRLTPELRQRDPDNHLYARGPRFRLDAEMIRDNALAVSGLLSLKMGGPPVLPPQPPGVWTVTGVVDNTYRMSPGEDRYRRGVYTIWRRSAPYASFVAFDAPDRASCTVQRPRTNTPLQALTLMNDPVYVEAAIALARRILTEQDGLTDRERVVYAFRLCLARLPQPDEVRLLEEVYQRERSRYQADPAGARALLEAWGGAGMAPAHQLAAWYHVAAVLLNLDEMITKG